MQLFSSILEKIGSVLHWIGNFLTSKGTLAVGILTFIVNYFRARNIRVQTLRAELLKFRQETYEDFLNFTFNRTDELGVLAAKLRWVWDEEIESEMPYQQSREEKLKEIKFALRASDQLLGITPKYNEAVEKCLRAVYEIEKLNQYHSEDPKLVDKRKTAYINLRDALGEVRTCEMELIEKTKSEINLLKAKDSSKKRIMNLLKFQKNNPSQT